MPPSWSRLTRDVSETSRPRPKRTRGARPGFSFGRGVRLFLPEHARGPRKTCRAYKKSLPRSPIVAKCDMMSHAATRAHPETPRAPETDRGASCNGATAPKTPRKPRKRSKTGRGPPCGGVRARRRAPRRRPPDGQNARAAAKTPPRDRAEGRARPRPPVPEVSRTAAPRPPRPSRPCRTAPRGLAPVPHGCRPVPHGSQGLTLPWATAPRVTPHGVLSLEFTNRAMTHRACEESPPRHRSGQADDAAVFVLPRHAMPPSRMCRRARPRAPCSRPLLPGDAADAATS